MAGVGVASLVLQSFAPAPEQRQGTTMNVMDYGAKGDGKTSDTEAIQKALDEAGKVNGTVWFPAGVYRCHELKVPPYVTLLADPCWIYHCEKRGAVLELDNEDASCLLDAARVWCLRW